MPANQIRSIPGAGLYSLLILFLCACVLPAGLPLASSESVVEIPVLAATQSNNQGVFEILLLRWDRQPSPSPMVLQWQGGNTRPGQNHLSSMVLAFHYALDHTPRIDHTGSISSIAPSVSPTSQPEPTARAPVRS